MRGCSSFKLTKASRPSPPAMRMSSRVIWGLAWRATSIASLPEEASATTINSVSSSMLLTPPRQMAWSSTSITVTSGALPAPAEGLSRMPVSFLLVDCLQQREGGPNDRSRLRRALDGVGASQQAYPLGHALQAHMPFQPHLLLRNKPLAFVMYLQAQLRHARLLLLAGQKRHAHPARIGVLAGIGDGLLDHAIGRRLQRRIETPPRNIMHQIRFLPARSYLLIGQ